MLALTGKPSRVSVETVLQVAPSQIWQAIAAAPQRFILVGDADHSSNAVRHELRRGLPCLAKGGVGHLAIEYPHDAVATELEAFNRHGPVRSLFNRLQGIGAFSNAHQTVWELPAYWATLYRLFNTARRHGMQLHALDSLNLRQPDPAALQKVCAVLDPAHQRVKEENSELEMGLRLYLAAHGYKPPALTDAEKTAGGMLKQAYHLCALKGDWQRAHMLQIAAGVSRAALLYGFDHFSGRHGIEPIGHYLPAQEQVYVALGTGSFMLREYKTTSTLRLPDFVIMADQQKGHVTPQAIRRGLWPAAGGAA